MSLARLWAEQVNPRSQVRFSMPRRGELAKAASRLDLAEHGLDDRLAQPAAAAMAALAQPSAQGGGRWAAVRLAASRMLGPSGCDMAARAALDEAGAVGLRAAAIVGRRLVGQAPRIDRGRIEQGQQAALIRCRPRQAMGHDDLALAAGRSLAGPAP